MKLREFDTVGQALDFLVSKWGNDCVLKPIEDDDGFYGWREDLPTYHVGDGVAFDFGWIIGLSNGTFAVMLAYLYGASNEYDN